MYKTLIRPLLFKFDPEKVHHFSFAALKRAAKLPFFKSYAKANFQLEHKNLVREVFGLRFKNPVGLAAGFDKDAKLYKELSMLGFGFIEVGTITPEPQEGNPPQRLFRLLEDEAIINRMGFNNEGVREAVKRLKNKSGIIIGGNIGKNKNTPNEQAFEDYRVCFLRLFPVVDYFVINVSSPNTPNLRDLQEKKPLTDLLLRLQEINHKNNRPKPILLKIAPDLTNSQLDDIIDIVEETKIAGVIATNTTIQREGLISENQHEAGGLSGKPLRKRSTEIIAYLHTNSKGTFPIIGVGGILTPEDAIEKLEAGASLIQIYTGLVYEGPSLVKRINKAILKKSV